MSIIADEITKRRPNLGTSSIRTYDSILRNLYMYVFGHTPDNDTDLGKFNDVKKIMTYLKDVEPNKRKTTLSALVILTGNDTYRKQMMSDILEYNKEQSKQVVSEKQDENWTTTDEVYELLEDLKKKVKDAYKNKDYQTIQNYIILCLLSGYYIPPRRSKDYIDFKIKEIDPDTDNYRSGNKLIFNSYKTAKTYGRQTVIIPSELGRILTRWINFNPTDYLLFDSNFAPLSNVKLNQRLNKLFERKVGVNQLRHTYLTDKYLDTIETKDNMASDFAKMGSSMIQEPVYIKRLKGFKGLKD
jgi:integrase